MLERLKIRLPIKPLSVNECWKGRHFKTEKYKKYDEDLQFLLPRKRVKGEWFKVFYRFYLKSFASSDIDNLVKALQDNLVSAKIIPDDRKIVEMNIKKYRAKTDTIEVEIESV